MINFSVVHQTSSQRLSLPPRREVEVYLWGYKQLIQPLAHSLAVVLLHTWFAGWCWLLFLLQREVLYNPGSCFWLCDRKTNQMPSALPGDKQNLPPNVGCPGSCRAQGQQLWMHWGCFGTEEAAAHKSCNAFSALLHSHQPSCVGHAATASLGCRPCAEPGCFLSWT